MSAPIFGTNVTRLSLVTSALKWTVDTLKEETSPDYDQATRFLNSCISALKPNDATRFAEQSPLANAENLLSDQDAKMHLGMQVSTLLTGAEMMTDSSWSHLADASPALKLPQLYTDPKRQHKAESVLAHGGRSLYPAGVLGSALDEFFQNGEEGTLTPEDVGNSVAAFSNPDFGDTPDGREQLMAGEIPGLREKGISTNLSSDDRLNPVAIPSYLRTLFAQHAGDVILAPVAQGLENCFPIEMARAIKSASPSTKTTRLISAVKGLNASGMTALEYIEKILNAVPDQPGAKKVSVVDVLGYIPVVVFMKQMQEYKRTGIWSGDPLNLVLACPDHDEALKLAKKWCRVGVDKGATVSTENRNGVDYTVVENKNMVPPMRIVLLTDPIAIKANELASIYKNLMGPKLGRELFNESLRCVEDSTHRMHTSQLVHRGILEQAAQEEERRRYLEKFYKGREKIAEKEIYQAINLDLGITNAKQLILNEVKQDMYGSWSVTDFNRVYQLAHDVFPTNLTPEKREAGIVKFKFNVGSAFTVRNIQYGFAWAANEAALKHNFSLKQARAEELLSELITSNEVSKTSKIIYPKNGGFFYFSLIPDNLTAEGVSIAENLRRRYKQKFKDLPEGIKEAANFVQRFHHQSFLGDDARAELLNISKDMAQALLPVESLEKKPVTGSRDILVGFIERISGALDKSEAHLRGQLVVSGTPLYERADQAIKIIKRFQEDLNAIRTPLQNATQLTHQSCAEAMQELIEIMALSNRIDILPLSATGRQTLEIARKITSIPPSMIEEGARKKTAEIPDRSTLADITMPTMTNLVFEMSQRLHSPTAVIQNNYLRSILSKWGEYINSVEEIVAASDSFGLFKPFIADAKKHIKKIQKDLKELSHKPEERAYALQSLIEMVIYARRLFIVNTTEDMGATVTGLEQRLESLSHFLDTRKANADKRPATPFQLFPSMKRVT